jgi:hypothetical protein
VTDAFHGSACLDSRPDNQTGSLCAALFPYRGSSATQPRHGSATTSTRAIAELTCPHRRSRRPRIVLHPGHRPAQVPCWSRDAQHWAETTVTQAYKERYERLVRPAMPNNPVALSAVVKVAQTRAAHADRRTGRDCRPTNERLAELTQLSVRTVQRASKALLLLGVATEVFRGRQRTYDERMASWRVGDKGRGWASVWALHDSRYPQVGPSLSPHLRRGQFPEKKLTSTNYSPRQKTAEAVDNQPRAATRPPSTAAQSLANRWMHDEHSPRWARRYGVKIWARLLEAAAQHGWTPADINDLIDEWGRAGHYIPANPHRPLGLLGAILKAHGNYQARPTALDDAREAAERAEAQARIAAQKARALQREGRQPASSAAGRECAKVIWANSCREREAKRRSHRLNPGQETAMMPRAGNPACRQDPDRWFGASQR